MTLSPWLTQLWRLVSGEVHRERKAQKEEEMREIHSTVAQYQNMELHYMTLRMKEAELKYGRGSKEWQQADQDFRMVRMSHGMLGGIVGSIAFKYPTL